jgi:hypothetical protein
VGRGANGDGIPVGVWVHAMAGNPHVPGGVLSEEAWGYAAGFGIR